jgi:hypothetical protein
MRPNLAFDPLHDSVAEPYNLGHAIDANAIAKLRTPCLPHRVFLAGDRVSSRHYRTLQASMDTCWARALEFIKRARQELSQPQVPCDGPRNLAPTMGSLRQMTW